ncbi:MAG: thioredoxin domain-containing protein [Methyloceanibacter sp.]|uniref:thioredoxin domain-containing protein n=1 Tax=Methyloceanibacter sp. TaxID=1965321 RepID=UPI003D6D39CE
MQDRPGNQLGGETSPYLLQHKDNPVHWRPWGAEALAEAKATGKPILLSVGYAACHWCHVMAHESFEDEATAAVMNDLFVNIKVDREERPDVDAIYMNALHQIGEQGGWPLTMFLTPDAEPFWGGTYFPREERYGRPSFVRVLNEIARIYRDEPAKVRQNANALKERLTPARHEGAAAQLNDATLSNLARRFLAAVDPVQGGIRGAPKFPQTQFFGFLWRAGLRYGLANPREAVALTLTQIAQGGIYDHLGGGFARYSVDERWLVPHFEKMLYDNALLIELMTEAWRETKSPLYAQRIAETIDWVLREMRSEGAFAASLDADSEGEEGKFYVWSLAEIEDALGTDEAKLFAEVYGVTAAGNFEGHNILNRLDAIDLRDAETEMPLGEMRATLLARRGSRVRPGFDDKILADWNGLMIAALANASQAFDRPDWLEAAQGAFNFIRTRMMSNGRLFHAYRGGEAKAPATANDYADMIRAALALANAAGRRDYIEQALAWTDVLDKHYLSRELGGYLLAADDTSDLIVRPFSGLDDATPNANAIMVSNLVQLSLWTGEERYARRAEEILRAFAPAIATNPVGHAGLLAAALDGLAPSLIVLIVPRGSDAGALRAGLRDVSLPNAVVVEITQGEALPASSIVYGKTAVAGKPTAYVCLGPQCAPPVTEAAALAETVRGAREVTVA